MTYCGESLNIDKNFKNYPSISSFMFQSRQFPRTLKQSVYDLTSWTKRSESCTYTSTETVGIDNTILGRVDSNEDCRKQREDNRDYEHIRPRSRWRISGNNFHPSPRPRRHSRKWLFVQRRSPAQNFPCRINPTLLFSPWKPIVRASRSQRCSFVHATRSRP